MRAEEAVVGYRSERQKEAREAKLRDVIEGWEQSGKTQKDYCEERGVKFTTFRGWVREYRAKEKERRLSDGVRQEAVVEKKTLATPEPVMDEILQPAPEPVVPLEQAIACEEELVAVDVVTRHGSNREGSYLPGVSSAKSCSRRPGGIGFLADKEPIEIELLSGIVIRVPNGTAGWRVAGIVRELQNTC